MNGFNEGPHCKGAIKGRAMKRFSSVVTGEVCGLRTPFSPSVTYPGSPGRII